MDVIKRKLSELKFPEKNIRIHTENQLNEYVRSINMFGQIRPVVIDENDMILAGNGLVLALIKAGKIEADVIVMADLSDNQKKKLMIADNKIFNLGIENLDTLTTFLEELGSDLDVPGFDEDILKTMVADAEEVTAKISGYGILDQGEIDKIKSNKDRKEARIEQATAGQAVEPDGIQNKEDSVLGEAAAEREHIVCPKCGETIWL